MYRLGFHSHTSPSLVISATANASGIAQGFLGPVPPGYCWYVERMTSWSNTALATPHLEIFVSAAQSLPTTYTATVGDRGGRQDISLKAANDISDNLIPIYVPDSYYLVAFWTGLSSGDLAQLSTQVAVHQLTLPEYGSTQIDVGEQHQFYHEQDTLRSLAPEPHN